VPICKSDKNHNVNACSTGEINLFEARKHISHVCMCVSVYLCASWSVGCGLYLYISLCARLHMIADRQYKIKFNSGGRGFLPDSLSCSQWALRTPGLCRHGNLTEIYTDASRRWASRFLEIVCCRNVDWCKKVTRGPSVSAVQHPRLKVQGAMWGMQVTGLISDVPSRRGSFGSFCCRSLDLWGASSNFLVVTTASVRRRRDEPNRWV
jgi:hypothetical protein